VFFPRWEAILIEAAEQSGDEYAEDKRENPKKGFIRIKVYR
jgi:hypothetical protein